MSSTPTLVSADSSSCSRRRDEALLLGKLTKKRPRDGDFRLQEVGCPQRRDFYALFCKVLTDNDIQLYVAFCLMDSAFLTLSFQWFDPVISVIWPSHISGLTQSYQWFDRIRKVLLSQNTWKRAESSLFFLFFMAFGSLFCDRIQTRFCKVWLRFTEAHGASLNSSWYTDRKT